MELQNILELDLGLQPGTSKGQTVLLTTFLEFILKH